MTRIQLSKSAFAAAWLACIALGTASADDSAGVARITDKNTHSNVIIRANNEDLSIDPVADTTLNATGEDCSADGYGYSGSGLSGWWGNQVDMFYNRRATNVEGMWHARARRHCWFGNQNSMYRCRNEHINAQIRDHLNCKFGYFIPTGCCGTGCPIAGRYRMVYAVDPNYADGRDGQLYSAQGYGVPMAVPLAPTVGHTYNYSWGLPASRLTPISNVAPVPAH